MLLHHYYPANLRRNDPWPMIDCVKSLHNLVMESKFYVGPVSLRMRKLTLPIYSPPLFIKF